MRRGDFEDWMQLAACVALCALIVGGAAHLIASAGLPSGLPLGR